MNTLILHTDEENMSIEVIESAASAIRQGGTVIFPTETVYGLGANALSVDAVKNIFSAKGRPSDNPLIVHISCIDMLLYLIGEPLSETARLLIGKYWPGPLTLIFKKSKNVPAEVTAGLDTVAVRMPDNAIALKLIEKSGLPIAAPSANLSGKPSPTLPEHVVADMNGRVNVIICGSRSRVGVESTVLDISGAVPTILRPGGITFEELSRVLNDLRTDPGLVDKDKVPKAPGMKYTHYAPEAEMAIVKGEMGRVRAAIQGFIDKDVEKGIKVGVLASDETGGSYRNCRVISLGSRSDMEEIASNIFAALREFDEAGVGKIYAEALEEHHIGTAVMNRMKKAAGFNIIEV